MPSRKNLIDGWLFCEGGPGEQPGAPLNGRPVELPHNAVDLPLNYFDETIYQRAFTYQRTLMWAPEFAGQEVWLQFDGAMADAEVWINGTSVARHRDGYTPFTARLTPHLRDGENLITVTVSGAENPEIPPFGGQIDYLTYAGLYREVWLVTAPATHIDAVKIETPDPLAAEKTVTAQVTLGAPEGFTPGTLTARLTDATGATVAETQIAADSTALALRFDGLNGLALWTLDTPTLYTLELTLQTDAGQDTNTTRFGFRSAEFTAEGFVLNGEKLKLMGLNRHQSFPYSGYAQGRRSQEKDVEILKHDLGCNIVRTSHYPQSPWFLDHCDRIGLLVFEEIPGWQHIGPQPWKEASVRNVEAMIRRDWNHPSIIIWGVRINESPDDHDFYAETNRLARALDPTRQTGGVRFITDSELLEDVYTMNDFILGQFERPGQNRPRTPLRPTSETTGLDRPVPYLVTEYNGHMFPTKSGDPELRQAEHTLRHLEVLNAMFGDPNISGCIGWCFFDYNTHKDFGSGDRLCHHGVADIFRNPKFAASAYASQQSPEARVVLEPVTVWARGERNIGGVLPLIVLTNCDEIEMSYGPFVKRVGPDAERFPQLPHPPVIIDNRHFTDAELGRWGMAWQGVTLTGYVNGKAVAEHVFVPDPLPDRLEAAPDATHLNAAARDEVRIVLRGLDQVGNLLRFLTEPVRITVTGPARLIGPDMVVLAGGAAGFWLRATGVAGEITVTLTSPRFPETRISITAA